MNTVYLGGLILFSVLAAATLVPHTPSSGTLSDLGYYTLCPYAPWSTLTLLFLAGLCYVLRQYNRSQSAVKN